MAILSGDLKLLASRRMIDEAEGGGPPSAVEIIDGASNQVYDDISEVDRAGGAVSMRKIFVKVDTDNTDVALDVNVIIEKPPEDPLVSVTLFTTGETFGERAAAKDRMESYLAPGVSYPGFLYGNHPAGMRALLLWQRSTQTPAVGDTVVLRKNEGLPTEAVQPVRIESVSTELRTYWIDNEEVQRTVVTMVITPALLFDFPGFDVTRNDPLIETLSLRTAVRDTIVADAARYYGVSPLQVDADRGAFTIKAESMYTQLVPSAEVETPVVDARINQVSTAVVPAGGVVTQQMVMPFGPGQNMFIGGAFAPGSLSVALGEVVVTDSGGKLITATGEVGTADYQNGILALLTDVFGGSNGPFDVTYEPAAVPTAVNRSVGFDITIANRSLNYLRTIEPPPLPGSLSASYSANGKWYTLRDNGNGQVRGSETGHGSGNQNFNTGTLLLTLGALPDVGSAVILQWVESGAAKDNATLVLDNDGKLYWPINSLGEVSTEGGGPAWAPGTLTFSWNDGAPRTATDDGAGGISGAAGGTVNYAKGVAKLSPNALPPKGTAVHVTVDSLAKTTTGPVLTLSGPNLVGNLGGTDIEPGTIEFTLTGQLKYQYSGIGGGPAWRDWTSRGFLVVDNGSGGLQLLLGGNRLAFGTVNYATGAISMPASVPSLSSAQALPIVGFDSPYIPYQNPNYGPVGG